MKHVTSTMDFDDEIDLHRKGWIIQRIGWVILLVILIAAALGVFGNGVLSKREVTTKNTLVGYERFGRFESTMALKINASFSSDTLVIKIPQAYFRAMELDKIVPEPDDQRIINDEMIFTFQANPLAQLTLYIQPKQAGSVSTTISVNGETAKISHFIYP